MFSNLRYRLCALFRRNSMEAELDEELRAHIQQQAVKYIRAGMSPEDAARRARLEFGGIEQVKEECRDTWGVRMISELARIFATASASSAAIPVLLLWP
jgi:putative ABC transport system permease protein